MINVAPHYTTTHSIRKHSTGKDICGHKNGSNVTTVKCTPVNFIIYKYCSEYEMAVAYRATVGDMTDA
jgi:hypothetical protein